MKGETIRVRGQVQGVGFRPTVWRLARELDLRGDVRNRGSDVEIRVWGDGADRLAARILAEKPPLARIETLERAALDGEAPDGFAIVASLGAPARAHVTPDAATCPACAAETLDPFARRYRYPFTNCTHCGPRFSIVEGAPYDRARTTLRAFPLCADCVSEYRDPADRRFHAQPIACHACGPRARFERLGAGAVSYESFSMLDDVDAAGGALAKGFIVAIKGVGGYHLACDATDAEAVRRLRLRKGRARKAFALMARDIAAIRRHCAVDDAEEAALTGAAAPIVLLERRGAPLPDGLAPGLDRLGFMLPYTPLHALLLRRMPRPVVMTSGNRSGEPQCHDDDDARARLAGIADFALTHDRPIANRIDDSVVRVVGGRPRAIRRARGQAPAPLALPGTLAAGSPLLAMGTDLKNAFCFLKDGGAILSQHMGDLDEPATEREARRNLDLLGRLYDFAPAAIAVDRHPAFRSTERGRAMARELGVPLVEVQHHHAHVASCMVENGWDPSAGPVVGVALDGVGWGDDGTVWGGEFLVCDYAGYERAGCLKPVAAPGGDAAAREPWRNAHAHLAAEMGWAEFDMNFGHLEIARRLAAKPRATIDAMIASGFNAPPASSCGRLFDAAAAMCGIAFERQDYEGEAASLFEAAIDAKALAAEPDDEDLDYPFAIPRLKASGLPYVEPLGAWRALLGDLHLGTPVGAIAARFHRGFAKAVAKLAARIAEARGIGAVALTGGCFQNATLFALVERHLVARGLRTLSHAAIPANDGGLAVGQAAVAAALLTRQGGVSPCA
ncbi:MAG: carbamoyltransferase HypF [Hyphomicrobiales bacterium]|nr:carbamoyltransferase HypF [Hyphomicrobiales bacterium]